MDVLPKVKEARHGMNNILINTWLYLKMDCYVHSLPCNECLCAQSSLRCGMRKKTDRCYHLPRWLRSNFQQEGSSGPVAFITSFLVEKLVMISGQPGYKEWCDPGDPEGTVWPGFGIPISLLCPGAEQSWLQDHRMAAGWHLLQRGETRSHRSEQSLGTCRAALSPLRVAPPAPCHAGLGTHMTFSSFPEDLKEQVSIQPSA